MMQRPLRVSLVLAALCFSWLAMQVVHEFGHVLHAWISGGRVERVVLHPLAISRTDVKPNLFPAFVAWGGAIWGDLIPLAGWLIARRCLWQRTHLAALFASFCLIANGAYLFGGSFGRIGDAGDLLACGMPISALWLFGVTSLGGGFWIWHCYGTDFRLWQNNPSADVSTVRGLALAVGVIVVVELLLSTRY